MMIEILKRYVSDELLDGQHQVEENDDLLTTDLIDSLGIISLVAFVEGKFELEIPPEDVVLENFLTLADVVRYIEQKKHEVS